MPEIIINGPEGRIEARYHHGRGAAAGMALVLHPHPQHGGTMNNKVVYMLYQCFVRRGFATLRFNFRGVGRSQGRFDRGEGELSDAAAALDWLQTYNPNGISCWIAGFSFGAWIGMQLLMRRPEIEGFIAVAPPANIYDFSFLAPCPSSGLILHGDQDTIVPIDSVQKLVNKLSHQRDIKIDFRKIAGADHFFNDHLEALATHVDGYIVGHARLPGQPAPPQVRSAR
jgi:uncharacterized protein